MVRENAFLPSSFLGTCDPNEIQAEKSQFTEQTAGESRGGKVILNGSHGSFRPLSGAAWTVPSTHLRRT